MINLENYIAGRTIPDHTGYSYFLPNPVNDSWIMGRPKSQYSPREGGNQVGGIEFVFQACSQY
jgi:hypothetical protein